MPRLDIDFDHLPRSGIRRLPRDLVQALRSPHWWFLPEPALIRTLDWRRLQAAWKSRHLDGSDAIPEPSSMRTHGLPDIPPDRLPKLRPKDAGRDRYGRRQWLHPAALRAFRRMQAAAADASVDFDLISAWRSHRYQAAMLRRKLRRGLPWATILSVSAPPGYSEHHTGCAVDIASREGDPLEESFEQTPAYEWLSTHATAFGFRMSSPRDNAEGYAYEPWHWFYVGAELGSACPEHRRSAVR